MSDFVSSIKYFKTSCWKYIKSRTITFPSVFIIIRPPFTSLIPFHFFLGINPKLIPSKKSDKFFKAKSLSLKELLFKNNYFRLFFELL